MYPYHESHEYRVLVLPQPSQVDVFRMELHQVDVFSQVENTYHPSTLESQYGFLRCVES